MSLTVTRQPMAFPISCSSSMIATESRMYARPPGLNIRSISSMIVDMLHLVHRNQRLSMNADTISFVKQIISKEHIPFLFDGEETICVQ